MSRARQSPRGLPLIIGHRGASSYAPENTLVAFACAFIDGADGIEFDVRLARDGMPVVMHDPTLLRTAGLNAAVSSLDGLDICALHAGAWFNRQYPEKAQESFVEEEVPLLDTVFRFYGARHLYVELKCEEPSRRAALARAVVELMRQHKLGERVVVKSFEHDAIAEVKRLAPEVRTAALFGRSWPRPFVPASKMLAAAEECGADEISLHRTLLRKGTVEEAHRRGFEVVAWTVNSPFMLRRAVALGLRAVITDTPRRLRDALKRGRPSIEDHY